MSIIVTDPSLLSQLGSGAEVELKGPSGKVLGVFVPDGGIDEPMREAAGRREACTTTPVLA